MYTWPFRASPSPQVPAWPSQLYWRLVTVDRQAVSEAEAAKRVLSSVDFGSPYLPGASRGWTGQTSLPKGGRPVLMKGMGRVQASLI